MRDWNSKLIKMVRRHRHLSELSFLLLLLFLVDAEEGPVEVKVGVVMDAGTPFGKMCLASINMAADKFYANRRDYTTRLVFHVRDSKRTTVGAASAALDLLKNVGVDALVGTQSSSQAVFVSDLAAKAKVPLVSFTATSPSLASRGNPFFVRTTLNDSAQVPAIASLVGHFSWREAALIYEDSEFGSGITPSLTCALQDAGALVTHRTLIPPSATTSEVRAELRKLLDIRTRVFLVHMGGTLGSKVLSEAARLGLMARGYVWIMTTGVTMELNSMDPEFLNGGSMEGVLGLRPHVDAREVVDEFTLRWKERFVMDYPEDEVPNPNIFSLWAHDTVEALAVAAENVGDFVNFSGPKGGSLNGSTNLLNLGVSRVGPELLSLILDTDFLGLSGRFQLIDGQLEVVKFELINVVGNRIETVGYWSPSIGISTYGNSSVGIGGILWPGKLKKPPRGWEWPVKGKKLRIAVPLADGLQEFVDLRYNNHTKKNVGGGFCVEVFEAAVAKLEYEVPYEYILFTNGTYDELAYQVYLNNFDAAVGDITIWSNRSIYVDFTTPFTESGVVMLVAIKEEPQRFWSFLDPMTTQLWVATVGAFFLTAFVVWFLEHKSNPAFKVKSLDELGRVLYFSFSTMVVAHREDLRKNFSRIVTIVWVLVVFVLTSSYTASMSSMLTSQQLKPSVTEATDLINKGEKVGYLKNSFVKSLLVDLGFKESNIIPIDSPEEYAEALSKGSFNGGVAAIFDEIPYVRIFLSKHTEYTVVGQTYKTDGFGFVFPRGSPLVSDISRAILKVKEGEKMLILEKKLYGDLTNAPLSKFGDHGISSVSNRLSFHRFLGLFLITGITSLIALLLHLAIFYYKNRNELHGSVIDQPLWARIITITRLLILGPAPAAGVVEHN